jgi:hypothetical protein
MHEVLVLAAWSAQNSSQSPPLEDGWELKAAATLLPSARAGEWAGREDATAGRGAGVARCGVGWWAAGMAGRATLAVR